MSYLLDTNIVSELRKVESGRADPRVRAWSQNLIAESTFLSVITVLELERGVLLMERRDRKQGAMLRTWFESLVLPDFAGRILPVDFSIAKRCAALHVPDPKSYRDSLIAATALVHGLTVVTRNVRHFYNTGVSILDPWEE
ncbi:MAG: type II toxin-antitoxin system VapC family toxin [Terracidiphilus sp.]